jgi:flavin reductase (DIM6/NTAB) family NADH-FMN oxidoreductase RutF
VRVSVIPPDRFRQVSGRFPSGVTVVTGFDAQGPAGFTCQSFHALSLEPPMIVFAVARTSRSWPRIEQTERCCVNVLPAGAEGVARAFATSGADKFAGVQWVRGENGSPVLSDAVAWFEASIDAVHPGGDHVVVIAEVTALGSSDGDPLLFHRGRYTALSD